METEIETTNFGEKGWIGKAKDWSYENWQTILVVLIVLIVGISAYNYNQQNNLSENQNSAIVADNDKIENDNKREQEDDKSREDNKETTEADIESEDQTKAEEEDNKSNTENDIAEELTEKATVNNEEDKSVISGSTDSGKIYTASANYGEGITHLARRAFNELLRETGEGSDLTEEHRIYVEDYLQNKIGNEIIEIGHQETFSEELIREAILRAKQLTPKSLDNLKKYVK